MLVLAHLNLAGCPVAAVASSPNPVTRSGEILGAVSSGSPSAESRKPTVATPSFARHAGGAGQHHFLGGGDVAQRSQQRVPFGRIVRRNGLRQQQQGLAFGSSWRRRTSFIALSTYAASASVSVAFQAL